MQLLYNFDIDTVDELLTLLSEPIYNTMEELEVINKNRKKGRNEIGK